MKPVPRAWDLTGPGDAGPFLEPEGLEAHAGALSYPCRALWVPLAEWDPLAAVPAGVKVLTGTRGVVLCGHRADLDRAAAAQPGAALARALGAYDRPAHRVRFADGSSWDLSERVRVMGIVNVTPDSFSDGGRFLDPDAAVRQADRLLEEGADIVDLGAESTRPGSAEVAPDEERRRLVPVIARLRHAHPGARLSVDTRHTAVAEAALGAGADMINDVAALADDGMAAVAARANVPVVLMHMRGTPGTMQENTRYDDLAGEVAAFLASRADAARDAGIADDRILVDPGLGFGKSVHGNVLLLGQLRSLASLGFPLLVGASRKGFIGALTGVTEPAERVAGSVAAALVAAMNGAGIVRVHDVGPTRQALAVVRAVQAT